MVSKHKQKFRYIYKKYGVEYTDSLLRYNKNNFIFTTTFSVSYVYDYSYVDVPSVSTGGCLHGGAMVVPWWLPLCLPYRDGDDGGAPGGVLWNACLVEVIGEGWPVVVGVDDVHLDCGTTLMWVLGVSLTCYYL